MSSRDIAYEHRDGGRLHDLRDVLAWAIAREEVRDDAHMHGDSVFLEHVWMQVPHLLNVRHGRDEQAGGLFYRMAENCTASLIGGQATIEDSAEMLAGELQAFLGRPVAWRPAEHWSGYYDESPEDIKLVRRAMRHMDIHRRPDFRIFQKAGAAHLLPLYVRTSLLGCFTCVDPTADETSRLTRVMAGLYLWLSLRSIEVQDWVDARGMTLAPVFQAALDEAQLMKEELGIPYEHHRLRMMRRMDPRMFVQQAKEQFGKSCLICPKGRHCEVLVHGDAAGV